MSQSVISRISGYLLAQTETASNPLPSNLLLTPHSSHSCQELYGLSKTSAQALLQGFRRTEFTHCTMRRGIDQKDVSNQ